MAREARKISKSGNYYIVLRGEELFVTEDDKKQFVQILEKNFATGILHIKKRDTPCRKRGNKGDFNDHEARDDELREIF